MDGKVVKGLAELKFNNGGRIYFTVSTGARGETVFLLLGGGKHGQSKDIKKASKLLTELFE